METIQLLIGDKKDMEEIAKRRVPLLKISSWNIFMLCAIAAIITTQLLSIYGTVHWAVLSTNYHLKSYLENVSNDAEAKQIMMKNDNLLKLLQALPNISDEIHKAGWKLLGTAALYHISGLLSFILALFAFFCRPRWVGLIALPIGIYSLNLAMVMM